MFRAFRPTKSIPGFSLEDLHAHAQLTAKMAGHVAADNAARRLGMIAGLLHDVGKLVLAEATPEHFARAIAGAQSEKRPLFEVEEELTGVSHAEVGAYLLSMWGIPYVIVEAVAHHHHLERVACDRGRSALQRLFRKLARSRARGSAIRRCRHSQTRRSIRKSSRASEWKTCCLNGAPKLVTPRSRLVAVPHGK